MQNLPNIEPMEVAVVSLAAVVLCFAPTVLGWADGLRRRRAERLASGTLPLTPYPEPAHAEAPEAEVQAGAEVSMAESGYAPVDEFGEPGVPTGGEVSEAAARPVLSETLAAAPLPPAAETQEPRHESGGGEPSAPALDAGLPMFEERPADPAAATHLFRLDELRRVRLPDWPPAGVRDDPERHRLWQEAQRVGEQGVITSAALAASVAVQSTCLGRAEADGPKLRLHFLLFPDLWPVSPMQAVAAAVFEVDTASGEIHRRVVRVKREE